MLIGYHPESMAKRVLIPILLLLLAVLAAAAFLIVLLCRPTLVVSDREAPLFQSSLSLNVVEYPHEGDIYSPVAAIYAMQDGLDVSRLACFGLSEEAASSFGTVYAVDERAMWNLVYDSYPDAAVLYDSTDTGELSLASLIPAGMASYAYEGELNSVTEPLLADRLAGDGVEMIAVYSPEKVQGLIRDCGCTVIVPSLYRNTMESGQDAVFVAPDFSKMSNGGEGGPQTVPWRIER